MSKPSKFISINSQDFQAIELTFYTYLKDNTNQQVQDTFNKILDQLISQ
jgi:hypothetical protein